MASFAVTPKENQERKNKALAVIMTLLIHAGLVLFLFYYVIITPIPPYPEPAAPELELDLSGGGGSSYAEARHISENNSVKAPVSNMPTVNNDVEPSTPIPSGKSPVVPKKVDTVARPKEPSIELANAENRFKAAKADGGGSATQGGQGSGGGGSGSGEGVGSGPGTGSGPGGNGFNYSLAGRTLLHRPDLRSNNPEQGQIVVGITVDQDGNVTEAIPGVRGSTITDASLYILVKNAARKIKFDKSPDGTPEQSGTVTFVFTIQ